MEVWLGPGMIGSVLDTTTPVMTDEARASDLRRMKMVATGLFVLAAVVFIVARVLEQDEENWGYLRATAEAAMVGALADWFAVTALFKHPLGLPIPHTAIIKKRKDQIGASLGGFVEDNFLSREVVTERLADAGIAARLGQWLSRPENAKTVGDQSAMVVRGITEVLQDDVVQSGLDAVITERAKRVEVAPLVGRVIDVAIEGEHHQTLLNAVLQALDGFMDENLDSFRNRLTQESPWWVPETVDDVVFDKIYSAVRRFLTEVDQDGHHEIRRELDQRSAKLAQDLRTSPELIARGEELKSEFLAHPEVRAWSNNLWLKMKAGLLEATEDPQSSLRLALEEALVDAGSKLSTDPELRAKVDDWINGAVGYVAEQFRGEVSELIATTVQGWDTEETAERIELQVGRDLQFIRINGTLVGGLAGLIIFSVSELLVG